MPGDIFESSLIEKLEARVTALEEGGGGGGGSAKLIGTDGTEFKNIPGKLFTIYKNGANYVCVTTTNMWILSSDGVGQEGWADVNTYTASASNNIVDFADVTPVGVITFPLKKTHVLASLPVVDNAWKFAQNKAAYEQFTGLLVPTT